MSSPMDQKDNEIPKKHSVIKSFNYAVEGIIYSLSTQRHMRFHYLIAFFVILGSLFFELSKVEFAIIILCIGLVIICEMINTAIESVVDLITDEYAPLAKIAKDVSAGAVLVSALVSVAIGYLIFFNKINPVAQSVIYKIRTQDIHIAFVGLILILIVVVVFKTLAKSGTPFQGGIISGHAALGFGLATAITLISANTLVASMSFVMAILVAQSRVEGKIHTTREVIIGGITGILVMILLFQIFKL